MATRLQRGSAYTSPLDPFSPAPHYSDFASSSFQTAEYIEALCRRDPSDVERIAGLPTSNTEQQGEGRQLVEPEVWVFEHLRCLAIDLSIWVAELSLECTRATCPEMRAEEWLYLCAAHSSPLPTGGCSAIDYTTHTLDGSVALLNSTRYFPSRLSVPKSSLKFLPTIARRLYRSFAHAFFHHRPLFESLESQTSLYQRFLALNANFDLIEQELLIIPVAFEEEEEEGEGGGGGDALEQNPTGADERSGAGREEVP